MYLSIAMMMNYRRCFLRECVVTAVIYQVYLIPFANISMTRRIIKPPSECVFSVEMERILDSNIIYLEYPIFRERSTNLFQRTTQLVFSMRDTSGQAPIARPCVQCHCWGHPPRRFVRPWLHNNSSTCQTEILPNNGVSIQRDWLWHIWETRVRFGSVSIGRYRCTY